jgi:FdhD protein
MFPDRDDPRLVALSRARFAGAIAEIASDHVAREEPLEIRVAGFSLAVVMRTPGHDEELVRGFLVTEGIVAAPGDIARVHHCSAVDVPEAEDNVIQVLLREDVTFDPRRFARHLYAGSSCGTCGKATLEAVLRTAPPLSDDVVVDPEVIYRMPEVLRGVQEVFEHTGGLHAAGLFRGDGTLRVAREDVGRHNAIDKVVGWATTADGALLAPDHVLCVSGRVSFEVVQKALAARIPMIAAVSAPTSLAVELAQASGLTLCAFVRGRTMCVYSAVQRVRARPNEVP